jgi:hypothetical protein
MIVDVESIGSNGPAGIYHRLWVSEPKARKKIQVVSRCEHSDAERVIGLLSGLDLRCDWAAGVLQHLLRSRIPLREARLWAALPIDPRTADRHYRNTGPAWSLVEVYLWHAEHVTPEQAALRYILPRMDRAVW